MSAGPDGGTRAADRRFEALGRELVYEGRLIDVYEERFRYPDGDEVKREIARHDGVVAVVAYDDTDVWLVRQPREAVGDPDLLEIPAGRLDKAGEQPLEAARRELAEEIGRGARHWEHLVTYFSSVGFTDETVHVYLATGLHEHWADSGEQERIEIVRWPLSDLDAAIAACRDAKTLIGLLLLLRRRAAAAPTPPPAASGA